MPMNTTIHRYPAAPRAVAGVGMVAVESGVMLGVVVVDANRPARRTAHPASMCATAGGLVKQLIATH